MVLAVNTNEIACDCVTWQILAFKHLCQLIKAVKLATFTSKMSYFYLSLYITSSVGNLPPVAKVFFYFIFHKVILENAFTDIFVFGWFQLGRTIFDPGSCQHYQISHLLSSSLISYLLSSATKLTCLFSLTNKFHLFVTKREQNHLWLEFYYFSTLFHCNRLRVTMMTNCFCKRIQT